MKFLKSSAKKYFWLSVFALVLLSVLPKPAFAYGWTDHSGSSGTKNWNALASDSTGLKLAAAGCAYGSGIYFGTTCTTTDDFIWTSTDGGATWTDNGGSSGAKTWTSIASDSTGMKLVATADSSTGGFIWTSTDGGATWTDHSGSSGSLFWLSVASDSTGMNLAAVDGGSPAIGTGGCIWTSTDGGATWTDHSCSSTTLVWEKIASDSTGEHLVAADETDPSTYDGHVWTSTDGGATWTDHGGSSGLRQWTSVASDSTGESLAATADGDYIWTSTDGGATWTDHGGSSTERGWGEIASDSTGTKLIATDYYGGDPYVSLDGGMTWNPETLGISPGSLSTYFMYYGVSSNASGDRLAVATLDGHIWTSIVPPSVTTVSSSPITPAAETINGHLDSLGDGGTATVGFTVSTVGAVASSVGTLSSTGDFSAELLGLGCGSTYTFTATADNTAAGGWTASGATLSFTTLPCPVSPVVSTILATPLSTTSEELFGHLYDLGSGAGTAVGFNFDGTAVAASAPATLYAPGVFSVVVPTTCGITYTFYATAHNSGGSALGAPMTFMTCAPPVWTDQTASGAHSWTSIASSASGMNLVAASYEDIYTSIDGGVTWTLRLGAPSGLAWHGVTSDASGTNLAAVSGLDSPYEAGSIYTSSDGGATWNMESPTLSPTVGEWSSIASNATGTHLAANVLGGSIWIGNKTGTTWTWTEEPGTTHSWMGIASSSSGTNLVAVEADGPTFSGYVWTSTDGGTTWTNNGGSSGSRNWSAVASDSTGTKLVASVMNGDIYTSSDGGATWTDNGGSSGSHAWQSLASSHNGVDLVAGINFGRLYVSSDSGATWTAQSPLESYWVVASSCDGTRLATGNTYGDIWTGVNILPPQPCNPSGLRLLGLATFQGKNQKGMSVVALQNYGIIVPGNTYTVDADNATIENADGTEADLSDIQAGDVLSIDAQVVNQKNITALDIQDLTESPQ